jgi:hypothetical protein
LAEQKPHEMSLDVLAGHLGAAGRDSIIGRKMEAEMMRRQTAAQISAARYMKWSVIAIAVTSLLNAIFAFLGWYFPSP